MPIAESKKIFIIIIAGIIISFSFGATNLYTRFQKPNYETFSINEINEIGIDNSRYVIVKNGYVNGDGIYTEIFKKFASNVTFPVLDTSNMNTKNEKILTSVIVRNNKDLSACMVDSSCIKKGIYNIKGKVFELDDLKDEEIKLLTENYTLSKNCIYIKTSWEKPGILINLILTLLPFMFIFYFRNAIFQRNNRYDNEDLI